jgi:hypothetical protein
MNKYLLNYQKTVNMLYMAGIASIITMPDIIFGIFVDLLHTLLELSHILFEVFEATLDHIVEHIFHTNLHETQVIVFYIMLFMVFGVIYSLAQTIPCFYRKTKENMLTNWATQKANLSSYWVESSSNKFKLIALVNAVGILFILFNF